MAKLRDRTRVSTGALVVALTTLGAAPLAWAQTSPPPTAASSAAATTAAPGAQVAAPAAEAGPAAATATADGAAPPADQPAALDEIVVTAAAGDRSRLKSSISVNSVSQEQINQFTPRSESEVFRLIPGIRAEDTAGSGGNSNITVRGLPIVTGGSEFVALQEDGLPVTLFGDMNFGNNDYWIRYDSTVQRLEAVRGGSASTLASQAPGAVINYISNTGVKPGGVVGVSRGFDFNDTRVDFNYGAPINDAWRFNIGGFYRNGDSALGYPYTASDGYQIKGNVTYELPENKGYIRLNFKRLDDKEPTFTTTPFLASLDGNTVGDFKAFPGFTAGKDTNQSAYNRSFQILGNDGKVKTVDMEGIHPKVTSVGFEAHYNLTSAITVEDKFRYTDMSGVFATQFYNLTPAANVIGSTVNGATVGSIVYANGPNQGKVFTGAYVNTNPNIYTKMRDMGNYVNDLTFAGKFPVMNGVLSLTGGWFHMDQTIDQEWHVNKQYNDATSGNNPAQLDLFSGPNGTGAQLTAAGQAGFNNNWGTCCARSYDLDYVDDAPYVSADFALGPFDLSGSLRYDTVSAKGTAFGGVTGPNVTVTDALGSATLPSLVAGGTAEKVDYSTDYLSYSFGLLYAIDRNNSVFGRVSEGGRANADRLILSGFFDASGKPNAAGEPKLQNTVDQQEIGFKSQGRLFEDVRYNFEATYFFAQTSDSNYDLTNQQSYDNVYHSNGLEVDGGINWRGFSLYYDATYTHARISKDATGNTTGNTPLATPEFAWLISPSYDFGRVAIGASITGQTSTYADNSDLLEIEGQTYVNGFIKVNLWKGLVFTVNANNLFDTIGTRGRSDGGETTPAQVTSVGAYGGYGGVFTGSAVLGRTITGALSYRF